MAEANNPFDLNFGLNPNNYISRLRQTESVVENFESDNGNKAIILTGVRGCGKTVLLTNVSKKFEAKKDWIVLELVSGLDMLEQLASGLYDSCVLHKIFNALSFEFSFSGISFSIKGDKPVANIITLISKLLDKLKAKGKKLLICVDEISANSYLKAFVQVYQVLLRKDYQIYLLMTGLYQNVSSLENDKSLTFLYRAPKIILEPLNIRAIQASYSNLLSVSEKRGLELAKFTKGYAFAFQVLGHLLWNKGQGDEKAVIDDKLLFDFDQRLQEYVYEKIYAELSGNDKKVLASMQSDGVNTTEAIIEYSKMDKKTFSVYRDRLIKRGVLTSPEYGKLAFSLPRFYNFVQIAEY